MAAQTEVTTNTSHVTHIETSTLEGKNKILGFWLFLGAETVLFACLFGTHLAFRSASNGGPTGAELFDLNLVAVTTAILLTSSLTSVFAVVTLHQMKKRQTMLWLGITVLLGLAFLGLEIYEFVHYTSLGHTMMSSAFGSSFYALVGTHGAHVTFGIFWISTVIYQVAKHGLNKVTGPKVFLATLYWHFVDVVWVFVFSLVYLLGKVG